MRSAPIEPRRAPGRRLALGLALCAAGCSAWRPAAEHDGWTLYVRDGAELPLEPYSAAIEPALAAVEAHLGPFAEPVRVHAWDGAVAMQSGSRGEIRDGEPGLRQDVPGIGPARVRAFHTRASGWSDAAGVFVGTTNVGTAVHELVHARLAEDGAALPLWFEEGLACVLGDGALADGRWVVDGLACWPYRELPRQELDDAELARLLAITPRVEHSVRDNVLVHFVGWAVVLDLTRELDTFDWRALWARFAAAEDPLAEVRRRMAHSLDPLLAPAWLVAAGADPDPGVRLAAVRGTWKIADAAVTEALLELLAREADGEVRASIAVNLLAAAGGDGLHGERRRAAWRAALDALERARVPDPDEQAALRALARAWRAGDGDADLDPQAELERLERHWQE